MEHILDIASKIPLAAIDTIVTGSATIGPPPVRPTHSNVIPTWTPPVYSESFQYATKTGCITLWVMFAAFIIITLIFMLMSIRVQKRLRLFHYNMILITIVTALSYYTMAAAGGWCYHLVHVHYKKETTKYIFRQIYWARYIDWTITSPLLLFNMTVLAGLPGIDIILLVFADIVMVLFGLFAAFTRSIARCGYYTISCVFYLYVIYTLLFPTRRAAISRNAQVGKLLTSLIIYTIVIWTLYPIVWALGEGTQRISVNTEIILFAVLDLLAKGVFGGWLLIAHSRISECHVPLTGWLIDGSTDGDATAHERRRLLEED